MKDKKGITLIAVVVTVVIMLILAGVTITVSKDGEIFNRTAKAVNAVKVSQEQRDEKINEIFDAESSKKSHNWVRTGDTFTCQCSKCLAYNANGRSLTIGQVINYIDDGFGTSTISADKTGYSTDQTIERDENTTWVVFTVKDSDQNGTFETLLITTETPTEDTITMIGAAPYNYWIYEADRMAQDLYGLDARAITIDDINSLGYTPTVTPIKVKDCEIWENIVAYRTCTPDPNEENTAENLGEYILDRLFSFI